MRLQVLICIDAPFRILRLASKRSFRDSVPTLLAIPALSPRGDSFSQQGYLSSCLGTAALFSLTLRSMVGQKIYARAERSPSSVWDRRRNATPAYMGAEALVVADVDLAHQYEIRKSTGESFPVRGIQVHPLIYTQHSALCKRYSEFQKSVQAGGAPGDDSARKRVREFTAADPRAFPPLLRDKLRHFLDHIDGAGLADASAWKTWVNTAVVSSTESTLALRAHLCSSVITSITQPSLHARNPSKVPQLIEAYNYLAKRYSGIVGALPPSDVATFQERHSSTVGAVGDI